MAAAAAFVVSTDVLSDRECSSRAGRHRRPRSSGHRQRSAATVRRKETHDAPRDPPPAVSHGARRACPCAAATRSPPGRATRSARPRPLASAALAAEAQARPSVAAVDRPRRRSPGHQPRGRRRAVWRAAVPGPMTALDSARAAPPVASVHAAGETGVTTLVGEVRSATDRPDPSSRADGAGAPPLPRAASAVRRAGATPAAHCCSACP